MGTSNFWRHFCSGKFYVIGGFLVHITGIKATQHSPAAHVAAATVCDVHQPLHEHQGRDGGTAAPRRARFQAGFWPQVGSFKAALSRPAHQRLKHTVRRQIRKENQTYDKD